MARRRSGKRAGEAGASPNGATVGHEAELWAMADALRASMDAAEYKHVVLGLIFLKYISDAFEERHAAVPAEFGEDAAEDRDEYTAENIFRVPLEARWTHLKTQASQPTIGLTVDQAMAAIERDNSALATWARAPAERRRAVRGKNAASGCWLQAPQAEEAPLKAATTEICGRRPSVGSDTTAPHRRCLH